MVRNDDDDDGDRDGLSVLERPSLPQHVDLGLDMEKMFREAVLSEGKSSNRRVLREWFIAEKGIWLDL